MLLVISSNYYLRELQSYTNVSSVTNINNNGIICWYYLNIVSLWAIWTINNRNIVTIEWSGISIICNRAYAVIDKNNLININTWRKVFSETLKHVHCCYILLMFCLFKMFKRWNVICGQRKWILYCWQYCMSIFLWLFIWSFFMLHSLIHNFEMCKNFQKF